MPMLCEERVISKTLLERFALEAEDDGGRFYGIIMRDNGDLLVHHPFGPNLAPDQALWASRVLWRLNRDLHHDGAWTIVFTNPKPTAQQCVMLAPNHCNYERYGLIWVDRDGDPGFTMEWAAGESELSNFTEVVLAGIESTMQKAETAWALWDESMQMLDVKPEQKFKKALGERAPSARN